MEKVDKVDKVDSIKEFSVECDLIIQEVERNKPQEYSTIQHVIERLEWLTTSLQIINKKLNLTITNRKISGAEILMLEEVAMKKINAFVIRHN